MERLALNKASLTRRTRQLKNYERFLPSLELKRKQLLLERVKARAKLDETENAMAAIPTIIDTRLPMLANDHVDLEGLVRIARVVVGEENVVGTKLPTLETLDIEQRPYGYLGRPHWVDHVARLLEQALRLTVRLQVERERMDRLEAAVRRITQRVNLFEKVLVPRAREDIRSLRIYLSDAERSAVVRGKIAKRMRGRLEIPA